MARAGALSVGFSLASPSDPSVNGGSREGMRGSAPARGPFPPFTWRRVDLRLAARSSEGSVKGEGPLQ